MPFCKLPITIELLYAQKIQDPLSHTYTIKLLHSELDKDNLEFFFSLTTILRTCYRILMFLSSTLPATAILFYFYFYFFYLIYLPSSVPVCLSTPSTCLSICLSSCPTHVYRHMSTVYISNCLIVSLSTVYLSTFCLLAYTCPSVYKSTFYLSAVTPAVPRLSINTYDVYSCSGANSGVGKSTILKYLSSTVVCLLHTSLCHTLSRFLLAPYFNLYIFFLKGQPHAMNILLLYKSVQCTRCLNTDGFKTCL
jgi:hypothetical protein